jgi:hypothetical protein
MYFVILRAPAPIPLVDSDYELRMFSTYDEAEGVAKKTLLGAAYGFVVYAWEE